MKIYAPNKQANGVYASVMFVNGVGETDDKWLIQWFANRGYRLEKCDETPQKSVEKCVEKVVVESTSELDVSKIEETIDTSEPDFDAMTPNELRDWMKANGLGMQIKNIRNKEKLLEIIRG